MADAFSIPSPSEDERGQRQKQRVALLSIGGAVLLTSFKLVVGLLTGSLGILAEAAHSTIDMVASFITFFAVRAAGKPADFEHRYGHGKAENLAAFVQAGLLLLTVAWIGYEAIHRLLAANVNVDITLWAFIVMGVSLVVDLWRSRALAKAAKEHNSQALAADALNFRTDLISSTVVLIGLFAIKLGEWANNALNGWLPKADSIAALGVAAIVCSLAVRMLRETIDVLLDRAPEASVEVIGQALVTVPGVAAVERIRVRQAGGKLFADVTVGVSRVATFSEAHAVSEEIERAVKAEVEQGRVDVIVHMEPVISPDETPGDFIRVLARRLGMRAHNIQLRDTGEHLEANLHVEVPPTMTLKDAHDQSVKLERDVRTTNPDFERVNTHIEAPETVPQRQVDVTAQRAEIIPEVRRIADGIAGAGSCHEVQVHWSRDEMIYDMVIHCSFPGELTVAQIHEQATLIERQVHQAVPGISEILVHAEPITGDDADPAP